LPEFDGVKCSLWSGGFAGLRTPRLWGCGDSIFWQSTQLSANIFLTPLAGKKIPPHVAAKRSPEGKPAGIAKLNNL
jgi:hypothetical protein